MEIDILIDAPHWDALDLCGLAQSACVATLTDLSLDPDDFALSILACDDARIATLNTQFRGKPTPTNVLSWPSEDRAPETPGAMPHLSDLAAELGDLALAFETCAREAADGGKPLPDHISHLIVHGLLHCLGFDHETDADADLMERLETRILARLGVPDPY
ncbi:rRNA maturation RNase YbeY [Jannaschia sp. CCS1]|uniref:Endoribonuclease YbeY n=1 Tax=Jannaschia sp. (strain CCS1) TaxID=290400 RepID=YBEY_JANSC|nr:rRNA maturation RNase YbeY [Jannaschia sp. CCS1]Q28UJ2.1 RecName: Full=Endoribonuclease YbeY [Jannaschia sp. CCS1]ABD53620.1 protein of unknown function UPF0054 [Jannaschia sp. CCS1]